MISSRAQVTARRWAPDRYLLEQLAPLDLAYLHLVRSRSAFDYRAPLRPLFHGAYLAGGGMTRETAQLLIERGEADALVFGNLYLANPDLAQRFLMDASLNTRYVTLFIPPALVDTSTTCHWCPPSEKRCLVNDVRFTLHQPFDRVEGLSQLPRPLPTLP